MINNTLLDNLLGQIQVISKKWGIENIILYAQTRISFDKELKAFIELQSIQESRFNIKYNIFIIIPRTLLLNNSFSFLARLIVRYPSELASERNDDLETINDINAILNGIKVSSK